LPAVSSIQAPERLEFFLKAEAKFSNILTTDLLPRAWCQYLHWICNSSTVKSWEPTETG